MRILLVDDDEGFRATLRGVLTQGGRSVEVEEAADGRAAVHKALSHPPDVVVMDLSMPGLSGVEATRQIKTRRPDLPVVILTVHENPLYQRAARAAGADGYLLKKTAGTALWPALARLVAGGLGARPGEGTPREPGAQARQAAGSASRRGDSPRPFRNPPDWRPAPEPL